MLIGVREPPSSAPPYFIGTWRRFREARRVNGWLRMDDRSRGRRCADHVSVRGSSAGCSSCLPAQPRSLDHPVRLGHPSTRSLVLALLVWYLFLLVSTARNPTKQGLHDRARRDTVVTKVGRPSHLDRTQPIRSRTRLFADARNRSVRQHGSTTDLCIIGAGAAGITLAREFIGSSVRVAVLESGGERLRCRDAVALRRTRRSASRTSRSTRRASASSAAPPTTGPVSAVPFDSVDFEQPGVGAVQRVADGEVATWTRITFGPSRSVQLTSDRWDTEAWVSSGSVRTAAADRAIEW